jgi:hypothetical protein
MAALNWVWSCRARTVGGPQGGPPARFDSQFACQTRQEFAENRAKRKSLRLAQKKRGS